jgi:hypothetical protein
VTTSSARCTSIATSTSDDVCEPVGIIAREMYGKCIIRKIFRTYHDFPTAQAIDWPADDKPLIVTAEPERKPEDSNMILCTPKFLQKHYAHTTIMQLEQKPKRAWDTALGAGRTGSWSVRKFLFTHKKSIRDDFKDIDCLLLWGGEDIHPSFYREAPHPRNETQQAAPSERDIHEWKAMLYCKAHNIPMIGVCRGAQFLCVFAGGKLAQDVDRHDTNIPIVPSMGGCSNAPRFITR